MLKNLKSLFIVEESDDENSKKDGKEVSKKDAKADKKDTTKTSVKKTASSNVTVNTIGVTDSKIIEKLLQAIEKNNLEGFDYLEFKKALKALEKMPMDEETKFRSTFATASTMGATLDKLVKTAMHYIGVLDKENTSFLKAFEGQVVNNIGNKEKEITQFESIIKEKAEKIKQLTEQITKHQQQIEELKSSVSKSKGKIDKTQNDFKVSYLSLRSQLEQDVEKMKKYLK